MATGDSYSRLVQIGKIVLPLVALGILSTLFLFSGEVDPEAAIPFAEVDVETIAREQRLTNPRFASVGTDDAAIELRADEARPDPENPDRIEAAAVAGLITLPGGTRFELVSGGAMVDMTVQTASLTKGVSITSTNGYSIVVDQLTARMDRAELSSESTVNVSTPFGTLQAGNMLLTRQGEDHRLVFNNKVKLVYIP